MSFILPINGKNYTIPQTGDLNWGGNMDDFYTAVSTVVSPLTVDSNGKLIIINGASINSAFGLQTLSSNPSAITGYGQVYAKTDGNLYYISPTGSVTQLVTPSGPVSGSGAANQVAYWSNSNTVVGNSNLTFSSDFLTLSDSVASGTVALTINNTSTTAPNSQLSLTAGTQNWILANTSGNFNFYNANTSSYAGYFQNATNYFILNNRLGIGTTSPKSLLDVNGNVTIGSYAGSTAAPTNGLLVSGNVSIGTTYNNSFNNVDIAGGVTIGFGNSGVAPGAPANGLYVNGNIRGNLVGYNVTLFGDGFDGSVTITSGAITLTRDMYYNNLTISGAGGIITNGYKIFVKGTLDLSAAGANAITAAGNNGTSGTSSAGGTGGVATNSTGTVGYGSAGGNGGTPSSGAGTQGSSIPLALSATQLGGSGGNGTGLGAGPGAITHNVPFHKATTDLTYLVSGSLNVLCGGTGGGGGGSSSGNGGGGGGGGGGVVAIFANTINGGSNSTTSVINVNGGNGGNSFSGTLGGGGGGGGTIYMIIASVTGVGGTYFLTSLGGSGGSGASGGTVGEIIIYNVSSGTFVYTNNGFSSI